MSNKEIHSGWKVMEKIFAAQGIKLYFEYTEEDDGFALVDRVSMEYEGHLYQLTASGFLMGWSITYNNHYDEDYVFDTHSILSRFTTKQLLQHLFIRHS